MARISYSSYFHTDVNLGGRSYTISSRLKLESDLTETPTTGKITGIVYLCSRVTKTYSDLHPTVNVSDLNVYIQDSKVMDSESGSITNLTTTEKEIRIGSFTGSTIAKTHSSQSIDIDCRGTISQGGETATKGVLGASQTIPRLKSFTVSYSVNGGGTNPGSQTKWYGETLTLRPAITDRSGYTFTKWNTEADGSGNPYSASANYTTNADAYFYAQWHQNPSLSYSVTSSGTYYQNASSKPYVVNVSNILNYDSTTISSIVLTVGSQTTSRTNAGNLSITPNTVGSFTPTLKITDSKNSYTTYTLTAIEVKANTAPTCSVSVTSSGYYYAGVSSYSVNITSAEAKNGKSISSIVLTVGTQTTSRTTNGALSIVPSSSGSKTISVTITDNIGASTTYSQTAITVYANDAPTLSYSVVSSGTYYAGATTTPYKVTISNLSGKNYKTITSVKLNFGSQNQTLTAAGTFSINPSTAGSITPTIVVTDNIGKTNTYTLTAVTVSANDPPTCSAAVASSGYYYVGVSKYKVTISNVSPKNSKTISSIVLKLGTQTVSRTNAGDLEITPSTAGTFSGTTAPTVVITDNIGKSTTYTMSAVTIYENKEPTATVTATTATVFYANAPTTGTSATPYTVTIANLTAYNNKTIVSAVLTIGSQTQSRTDNGTLTITPSTPGTFTPTVVIKDNIGKTKTYSLTAITVRALDTQASDITAQRIIAATGTAGVIDDEGTNVVLKVKFTYSNYTGANGKNYLLQPVVKVGGTQTSAITWYTGWTSSGGFTGAVNWSSYQPSSPITLYAKVTYTFAITTSYSLGITPKSTAKTGAEIVVNVPQAFYLLAGKAGGHALGIGKKPAADGILDVGMGSIRLNNYNGSPPQIEYQGAFGNYPMIKFKDGADVNGNGIVIGGGGLVVVGSGESATAVANTHTSGGDEILDLASDGSIKFWTNVQNGTGSAHTETIDASGIYSGRAQYLYVPRVGNANTINVNSAPLQYHGRIQEYGPSCLNMPTSAWYFIETIRGADNNYCAQLAIGETVNAAYYRVLQNGTWGSWTSITNTNTWRGIQDNLTSSTNTTESLSAKQGYLLANGSARDSTKLPLAGGTMSGSIIQKNTSWTRGTTPSANAYRTYEFRDNVDKRISQVEAGFLTSGRNVLNLYVLNHIANTDTYGGIQIFKDVGVTTSATASFNANTGLFTATSFSGNGASLTSLNASNISSGTLAAARLATSGATAGSYGPSANAEPGYGATFNVPYITIDTYGRVTAASTKTVKIPASDNTNNAVTQTATTTSAAYEVLFSATADNTTRTEGARKTSTLTYNPSTKVLNNGGPYQAGGYKLFTTGEASADNVSIDSGGVKAQTITITAKTGYTPIGVIGWYIDTASSSGANFTRVFLYRAQVTSTTQITVHMRNTASSAAKVKVTCNVLYISSTQGT